MIISCSEIMIKLGASSSYKYDETIKILKYMKKLKSGILVLLMLGSIIMFSSHIEKLEGQSKNSSGSTTNITMLGKVIPKGAQMELHNKTVNYFDSANGYLTYPLSANESQIGKIIKFPAVIMVHEWWGLNDNIKDMANLLARQGYVVLAVDLFGGHIAADASEAQRLVQMVGNNEQTAIDNLKAAVKYASSLSNVDGSRIGAMGWCFGGGQALQLAINSQDHPLSAAIVYYGTPLITDKATLSKIKWPVLGIFGDKDAAISTNQINEFKDSLDANGIINQIITYKGLGHAFANPSGPNFAPKETQDAWQKTSLFLKKYLG